MKHLELESVLHQLVEELDHMGVVQVRMWWSFTFMVLLASWCEFQYQYALELKMVINVCGALIFLYTVVVLEIRIMRHSRAISMIRDLIRYVRSTELDSSAARRKVADVIKVLHDAGSPYANAFMRYFYV
jgi:hypothetical protein